MAKDKVIEIIGGINDYNISRDYVKYMLDQAGAGPVFIDFSSLGGDVNQALQIKKFIADRGDVTLRYFGFNASSSTVVGHGAVKTQIYEDSMYLVHKPLVGTDPTWGSMNEDQIQAAIDSLISKKNDASAATLIIAQEYVTNRNLEMSKVMELITAGNWITAQKAVELGLVDEVIPSSSKKSAVTNEVIAMMTANGFPAVPVENSSEEEKEETLITKIINKINSSTKTKPQMTKDYSFINSVLGIEGVEVKDGMVSVTVENILKLNNEIKAKGDAVTTLTAERDTAVTDKATAETALNDATSKIDAIHPSVKAATTLEAKVTAINAELAKRPAAKVEKPHGKESESNVEDAADWDTIDNLEHNKIADKEI